MKKSIKWFKMNLVVCAFALASFMAVAFKPANVETGLHWFEYDGSNTSSYIGTSSQALLGAGCPSTSAPTICALGFSSSKVDLSDPDNPVLTPEAQANPMAESTDERYRSINP